MCKVSVLMPVYNAERYLAEAIESIISQTYSDWELVIINDGSQDGSESIISTFDDSRIRYYENEKNLGLIDTLNRGVSLCKGELIARMDADDISKPTRLEEQVAFLDKNKDYILVGSNAIIIDPYGNERGKIVNPSENIYLQISLLFTNPFVHPSCMMRKEGFVDCLFDKNWLHTEDFELWTRFAQKGKLCNLKTPLLKYRWHDANISVSNSSVQEISKDAIVKKQLRKLGIEATQEEIDIHRLTFKLYSLGRKNTIAGEKIREVEQWFERLAKQNKTLAIYPQTYFEAFLWSRWIVLCMVQKKKLSIFCPKFISYKPTVILRTIKLVVYLSRK